MIVLRVLKRINRPPAHKKKKTLRGKEKAKLDVHFYDLFGTQI